MLSSWLGGSKPPPGYQAATGNKEIKALTKADWPQVAAALAHPMAVYPLYAWWLECPIVSRQVTVDADGNAVAAAAAAGGGDDCPPGGLRMDDSTWLVPSRRELDLCRDMALCHLSQTSGAKDGHLQLCVGDDVGKMVIVLNHGASDAFPGTVSMLWHGFPLASPAPPKQAERFFNRLEALRKLLLPRMMEVWFCNPMTDVADPAVNALWLELCAVADQRDAHLVHTFIPGGEHYTCALYTAVAHEFTLYDVVSLLLGCSINI